MASSIVYPAAAQLHSLLQKLHERHDYHQARGTEVFQLARRRHLSEAHAHAYETALARAHYVDRVFMGDLWRRYDAWLGYRDYPDAERERIAQLKQDWLYIDPRNPPSIHEVDLACSLVWEYGADALHRLSRVFEVWKYLEMMVGDVRLARGERRAAQQLVKAMIARMEPSVQQGLGSLDRCHIWLPVLLADYDTALPAIEAIFGAYKTPEDRAHALHTAYADIPEKMLHDWIKPPDDASPTVVACNTAKTMVIAVIAHKYQTTYKNLRPLLSQARHVQNTPCT